MSERFNPPAPSQAPRAQGAAAQNSLADWPLSRALMQAILEDRVSDRQVCVLIWTRLGYEPSKGAESWSAGRATPQECSQAYSRAPQVIAERPASVRFTRSIAREYKQLLKEQLGFQGYRISELVARRTRRATAVNWLLAWLRERGKDLPNVGPLPPLWEPPSAPLQGHPGDPPLR